MQHPLQLEVRQAFQKSMHLVWIVMEVACAIGLLSFFAMRDLPLQNTTDKNWGIKDKAKEGALENGHTTELANISTTSNDNDEKDGEAVVNS